MSLAPPPSSPPQSSHEEDANDYDSAPPPPSSHGEDVDDDPCPPPKVPLDIDVDFSALKLDVGRLTYRYVKERYDFEMIPDLEDTSDNDPKALPYAPTHLFMLVRDNRGCDKVIKGGTKELHVWSSHFLEAAKEVLKWHNDIDWEATPVKFDPQLILGYLPRFETYLEDTPQTEETEMVRAHVRFLIDFMRTEYAGLLAKLEGLLAKRLITFDLLWGLFIPGSRLVTRCEVTGESLAVQLMSCYDDTYGSFFQLTCQYVDVHNGIPGYVEVQIPIQSFRGTKSILELRAFPAEPYLEQPRREELYEKLIKRGHRFWELSKTWCHKDYEGAAYEYGNIAVKGRIILDRERHGSSGLTPLRDLDGNTLSTNGLDKDSEARVEMTDDEYMSLPAVVYGFSLGDRKWVTFNVNLVRDIEWHDDAFEHLEIPKAKKDIVKCLIESHNRKVATFDDFIPGKGLGLIFALHGSPGVGKTLTAEATSEVSKRPLYMVGAGDLGTNPSALESALKNIFDLASAWRAIVLIDEADVFLERRDVRDLNRNAMVAVFLRHLEYYTGILILTTNRLEVIDPAMKSRIHVSLYYDTLGLDTRRRLWSVFLQKAGLHGEETTEVDAELMKELCQRPLNGREIKNIVKTASTLAAHHGHPITIHDILYVIHATEEDELFE